MTARMRSTASYGVKWQNYCVREFVGDLPLLAISAVHDPLSETKLSTYVVGIPCRSSTFCYRSDRLWIWESPLSNSIYTGSSAVGNFGCCARGGSDEFLIKVGNTTNKITYVRTKGKSKKPNNWEISAAAWLPGLLRDFTIGARFVNSILHVLKFLTKSNTMCGCRLVRCVHMLAPLSSLLPH